MNKVHLSSRTIANDHNLEYIFNSIGGVLINDFESYYSYDKYISFYPSGDGLEERIIYWYNRANECILINDSFIDNIVNIEELLIKMTNIYLYYVDKPIIINPFMFALKLCEGEMRNYKGYAKLVIQKTTTDSSIPYSVKKMELEKLNYELLFIKYFVNLNFREIVNNSNILSNNLTELNNKMSTKL